MTYNTISASMSQHIPASASLERNMYMYLGTSLECTGVPSVTAHTSTQLPNSPLFLHF